ncbi:uncharacterized protein LOC121379648 [Gigantopelta aegis]|uniref:uncharacterized protein LOC121379648 n=1 Tax=Gigantopelta aegis TaxID=1735272 RepID=UPI001B88CD31|nr:uncharacterized protein LOC121379648 [Gigantopelta aegis]
MSLRPHNCEDFYLRPLKYTKQGLWYCSVPVGRHLLSGVVRRLCENAGFNGFYTNCSLRATTATRLYECGIDEQLIAERTGHRSSAIRGYKRTSDDLLKMVDDVVQRKVSATTNNLKPPPYSTPLRQQAGRFDNATVVSTDAPNAVQQSCVQFVVERNGTKVTVNWIKMLLK